MGVKMGVFVCVRAQICTSCVFGVIDVVTTRKWCFGESVNRVQSGANVCAEVVCFLGSFLGTLR